MSSADPAEREALRRFDARTEVLRRPGACDGIAGPVERIDTPISTLLLAGDAVFKFKRPVHLPFVDFSTPERRLAACLDELRLNRRTAPALYRGLAVVREAAEGPRLSLVDAGTEAAIAAGSAAPAAGVLDVAVHLGRFDAAQCFDQLARRGELGAVQVDALATAVVRFHAALPLSPPGWGGADALRRVLRDNLAELRGLLAGDPAREADGDGTAARLATSLAGWVEARGAALALQVERRRAEGHVREGHGDLHLANLLWDADNADAAEDAHPAGQALLFDALEFDPALRHIDTVGDWAFAFMDLHAHGLPRLAWRFANAVIEASGDHGALPLLAWWAVHRALVRAKVALLAGTAAGRRAAVDRIALAARLAGLDPSAPPPRLVAMMGLSGSGKSTVAGLVAERLGALRLRSDVERKRLFGLAPHERPADRAQLYGPEAGQRTYARLLDLADGALAAGVPVVLDAANLRRAEREAFRALAARHAAAFTLLLCEAPPGRLAERVLARAARGGDPSDATPEVLALQQRIVEWPDADEAPGLVRLDTDAPLAEVARRCEALRFG